MPLYMARGGRYRQERIRNSPLRHRRQVTERRLHQPAARVEDKAGRGGSWTVEINPTNATDKITTRISCYDFPPLRP
jgi:hypothetical protein